MFGIKALKKEIVELKQHNNDLSHYNKEMSFFTELGVSYAQKIVNGYRVTHWQHFLPGSSLGLSYNMAVKAMDLCEGTTGEKLIAALKSISEKPGKIAESERAKIYAKLKKSCLISADTGKTKPFTRKDI